MKRWAWLAVGLLVLALAGTALAVTVAAQGSASDSGEVIRGEPDLEVFLSDREVTVGNEETLELAVHNDGELDRGGDASQADRVLTANGVTVEVTDDGPFDVKSGKTAVGAIQDGTVVDVPQRLVVPSDLEPGEYEITVEVSYSYTESVSLRTGNVRQDSVTETHDVTVVVPDEPRFTISDVETDVEAGTSGDATLEIENVGFATANDLRATIEGSGGVTIDGGVAEERLADLAPGETTEVTVDAAIADTASSGAKPLEATFTYRDASGVEHVSDPITGSLAPGEAQSFSIDNIEDTLSVGYDGEITGTIVNDGPRSVDDAVIIAEPMSDSLHMEDTNYALPELEPGEAAEFRYPTDVSGSADDGPRQIRFTVQYSHGDTTLETDPISERVVVDPQTDEFSLEGVETTVAQGETEEFVLEITNERPETLSNIDALLYTDLPLSSSGDSAFVGELESGESAVIAFELEAAEDARATTYPVELDFEYETERGDTELSDTYQFPVDVTENENPDDDGGFLSSWMGLLGALTAIGLIGAGIAVWWRHD